MEILYSKLYDKYTKLKVCSFIDNQHRLLGFVIDSLFSLSFQSKKLSDLDHINKEQEVKFVNYLTGTFLSIPFGVNSRKNDERTCSEFRTL